MKLTCDLCDGSLQMNNDGQGAVCTVCGILYPMARLKEKLKSQKAESEKQIDLLQERLDGALEVNAKLRRELEEKKKDEKKNQKMKNNVKIVKVLWNILLKKETNKKITM